MFEFDANYVRHFGLSSVSFISFLFSFHYGYNIFLPCSPSTIGLTLWNEVAAHSRTIKRRCMHSHGHTFRLVAVLHVVLLFFFFSFGKRNGTNEIETETIQKKWQNRIKERMKKVPLAHNALYFKLTNDPWTSRSRHFLVG